MVAVKLMLKNINLDKEPPQIGFISLWCWLEMAWKIVAARKK